MEPLPPSTLAAAHAGDAASREAVARALLPVVLAWCGRLGGPGVDREEAAHDVLMTVLRRLGDLDGAERLEAWTFGITRRIVASHRRRVWFRRWVPGLVPDRPDPRGGPVADAVDREIAAQVDAILDELPAAQREALVLCDVEERPAAEVAAMLGVPEGTVKSRLRLARARFRELAAGGPLSLPEAADE